MPNCAVLTCKSSSKEVVGLPDNLTYHRFPRNEELMKKWVYMTGRENWTPNDKSFICSKHFRDNDYIVKRSGSRHLKVTATPCEYVVYRNLFPDEKPSTSSATSEAREATPSNSPIPTTSAMAPPPTPAVDEADTTSNYDYFNLNDLNDNTIGWDQFQNVSHFEQREPEPTVKRRSSTGGAPAKRKRGKKSKAKKRRKPRKPSPPVELFQPQMEEVAAPFGEMPSLVEEPQLPFNDVDLFSQEIELPMVEEIDPIMEVRPPTPEVRPPAELDEQLYPNVLLIGQRKQSRREESATKAAVSEDKTINTEVEDAHLNEIERAEAIINVRNKQILKLSSKHRKLRKLVDQISTILQNLAATLIMTLGGEVEYSDEEDAAEYIDLSY